MQPRSITALSGVAALWLLTAVSPAQFGPIDLIIGDLNGAHYRLDRNRVLSTIPMRVAPPYTPVDFTSAPNQTDMLMGFANLGGSNGFGSITSTGSLTLYGSTPVPMLDLRGDSRVMSAPIGGGDVMELDFTPGQRPVFTTIATVTADLRGAAVDPLSGDLLVVDAITGDVLAITVPGGAVRTVVRSLPATPTAMTPHIGLHFDPTSREMLASYGNAIYRFNPRTGSVATLRTGAPFTTLGVGDVDATTQTYLVPNTQTPSAIFSFDPRNAVVITITTLSASMRPGVIAAAGTPQLLATAPPKPGASTIFRLRAPGDANGAYVMALSFGYGTGLPVPGGRLVHLAPDDLFRLSLANTGLVSGFQGSLDANGDALGILRVPNVAALRGARFFAAAVTFVGGRVSTVTETIGLTVR